MLRPKILDALKGYSPKKFAKDSIAGIIVGIIALPLAIAFAIASGVTPEKGLYTAIIAGLIISVLGGSRVQIGGPTGAFVIIIYGIIQKYGYNGLLIATIMSGIILIIFGLAKFGSVIKFIPHSVIVGFTFGIAVLVFAGQISDFLGLGLINLPADFVEKMRYLLENISAVSLPASCVAMGTVMLIVLFGRISKTLPGSLIALFLASLAVHIFKLPLETIGSRFGAMPHVLPKPSLPLMDFNVMRRLINPAFTIAILGSIESLLSAVVADGMIGGKHRSNMELVAQGVANIASPIFGGIPATGAIARTATNVKSGGRTPIAGIVHALVLMLIMMFFGRYVSYIPMACLAGILVVVAYNMSEWRSALAMIRTSRGSGLVMLVTFVLTIVVDLTAAIEIGFVLATFVFIRSMSIQTNIAAVNSIEDDDDVLESEFADIEQYRLTLPKDAIMYEINGPLFFGAVYKFREALAGISKPPKVLILQMKNVPVIDSTGLHALNEAFKNFKKKGTVFVLCGLQSQIKKKIERAGLLDFVESLNICKNTKEALSRAHELSGISTKKV